MSDLFRFILMNISIVISTCITFYLIDYIMYKLNKYIPLKMIKLKDADKLFEDSKKDYID